MCAEMVMPSNFVDMSQADLEYDGSFSWKAFGKIVGQVVAIAAGVALMCFGQFQFGLMAIGGGALLGYSGIKDATYKPPVIEPYKMNTL